MQNIYILIYKQQLTPMLLLWGHGPFSFYCITDIGPDDDSHTTSNTAANILHVTSKVSHQDPNLVHKTGN